MLYDKAEKVFYNKVQVKFPVDKLGFIKLRVQVLNRDMSIQVISEFSRQRAQEWRDKAARKSSESKFVVPDGKQ